MTNKYVELVEKKLNEFVFKFGTSTERELVKDLVNKSALKGKVTIASPSPKKAGTATFDNKYKDEFIKLVNSLIENEETVSEAKKKGKKDYTIYHNSYSEAVTEVMDFIKKNGFDDDGEEFDDAVFMNISTGSKRPKNGQTTRVTLPLWKDGKPQRKRAHFQVYGMDDAKGRYELNLYIS